MHSLCAFKRKCTSKQCYNFIADSAASTSNTRNTLTAANKQVSRNNMEQRQCSKLWRKILLTNSELIRFYQQHILNTCEQLTK